MISEQRLLDYRSTHAHFGEFQPQIPIFQAIFEVLGVPSHSRPGFAPNQCTAATEILFEKSNDIPRRALDNANLKSLQMSPAVHERQVWPSPFEFIESPFDQARIKFIVIVQGKDVLGLCGLEPRIASRRQSFVLTEDEDDKNRAPAANRSKPVAPRPRRPQQPSWLAHST